MKADLLYSLDHGQPYRRESVIIPKSGKYLDMDGWKPRLTSFVWGAWSKELAAQAAEINGLQQEVDSKRRLLNEALRKTQATLIAAAKAAPKDVVVKGSSVEPITDDMV